MKMALFLAAALLTAAATPAQAEPTLKGGHVACLTRDLLDQAGIAAVKKDERAWAWLKDNGCIIPKAGTPYTLLDIRDGNAKIRVYGKTRAFKLWTADENLHE